MNYGKIVFGHIGAFAAALMILMAADRTLTLWGVRGAAGRDTGLPFSAYIPQLNDPSGASELILGQFLKEKKLVIFGSSELSGDYPEITYRWIPRHTGLPALAIGQGGFQCLPMHFVLYKFREYLDENSRVVIIISPQWFRDGDASLAAVLPFAKHGDFRKMDPRDAAAQTVRDFLLRKRKDFGTMPVEVQLFVSEANRWNYPLLKLVDGLADTFLNLLRNHSSFYGLLVASRQARLVPNEEWSKAGFKMPDIDWEAAGRPLIEAHALKSKGNSFGFYDSTYAKLRRYPPTTLKKPVPGNHEYQALEAMVKFLSAKKVRAIFVQHPLNALAYTNLEVFDEQGAQIRALMMEHGLPYLDFTHLEYQKAWLSDYAHFSGLAWLKMNKFVAEELAKMGHAP